MNVYLCSLSGGSTRAMVKQLAMLALAMVVVLSACSRQTPQAEIKSTTDEATMQEEAEALAGMNMVLADGLQVSLWASQELLGDPVALHMQNDGSAYVTVTTRSRASEFDIRDLDPKWLAESMRWKSVDDRRQYLRTELAPDRSALNTWLPDRNNDGSHDWRDLKVEKESVYRLRDLTGDGRANEASRFVHGFHEEISDVAGGVVAFGDDVFLAVGPDMWRLRDTNGNGVADEMESISHGYNVHIGFSGHGMSGATVGPDGRIYWAIGDMGFNVIDREGNHWFHPNDGAILRSEPDGSNFEVYAYGLRNTHEFVFDTYGNLITVDNDGDHPGEHERLVHLIHGSDSGWRINWQFGKYTDEKNNDYKVWMDEELFRPRFEGQSAHILPPLAAYHAGPAGMAFNPGTALSERWRDHFFVMSFRGNPDISSIYAFTLEPEGASFRLKSDERITSGLLAVGMDFGPDGALYMTDWISGWMQKDQGRIWRLDDETGRDDALRADTRTWLEADFVQFEPDVLAGLLAHADMRVRSKAQFELARRGDVATLLTAARSQSDLLARIHGLWGVGQIGRRDSDAAGHIREFLTDPDAEIRAQAARQAGDTGLHQAGSMLVELLSDESPRVQLMAAEALGRLSYSDAFDAVVQMVRQNNNRDAHLRHAGAIALARIDDGARLGRLHQDASPAVRLAAVVALKRLRSPEVSRFLSDSDPFIVTDAARAISDDLYIEPSLVDLAVLLDPPLLQSEAFLRRAINANLYSAGQEAAMRLARFSLRAGVDPALRIEALQTLQHWEEPSIFDRVTGRYRGARTNNADDARQAIASVAMEHLRSGNDEIILATLNAIGRLQWQGAGEAIAGLAADSPSAEVRITALNTLEQLADPLLAGSLTRALEDSGQSVRLNALGMLARSGLPAEEVAALFADRLSQGDIAELRASYAALAGIGAPETNALLAAQMRQLMQGALRPEVHLDLLLAVEQAVASPGEELQELFQAYESARADGDMLDRFRETLYGGNPHRGRRIFVTDVVAQCMRCHVVNDQGAEIGPELTHVADRYDREGLLLAMVDPADPAMPAMGNLLTREQLRDLVAYLYTLRE